MKQLLSRPIRPHRPPRAAYRFGTWGVALVAGFLVCGLVSAAGPGGEAGASAPRLDPRSLQQWQAMRFGMFIHWGPVSLKGTEIGWSRGDQVPVAEYDALYRQFNPAKFNADTWVRTAKAAGMKYIVFTTKHHDGFCMWNTQQTDYNIMHTPFGRDVVKELADACRRHGILFGMYHSICDWHQPDYPLGSPGGRTQKPAPDMDRYDAYLKRQLRELLTGYGKVGIAWFDGEWEAPWTMERGQDLARHVRTLQPGILINNRVGKGREDMAGTTKDGAHNPGDYDTPEQQVGRFNNQRPWESCITICQQWAWKPNDTMKSLPECLQTLITCAGGDGNLLFNVGPRPSGEIEPRQVARLKEMGAWLKQYGKTIYRTRGGPFRPGPWGVSTCQGDTVYVHILHWPDTPLRLPAIDRSIKSSRLVTGGSVKVVQSDSGIVVEVPPESRREVDTIVCLRLNGDAFSARPAGQ